MSMRLLLTGDVNLMNVDDPETPFRKVRDHFATADVIFSNLECCLYAPPAGRSVHKEGFYAEPEIAGRALRYAGIDAVGIANNVNYGDDAILESVRQLDALGLPRTGAGQNLAEARRPAIVERNGLKIGFVQRSSVYWPVNHEALADGAGIAVLRGHTAYHVPAPKLRSEIPSANRPGVPPEIITWADPGHLAAFCDDIRALRERCDIVVASCHWGLMKDVLAYMREIGHAAIDAGADIVVGHGPHYSLPIEFYKGRPIFYGLGSFCFHTGHFGQKHGDWLGLLADVTLAQGRLDRVAVRLVRHNDDNETFFSDPAREADDIAELAAKSAEFGAQLAVDGDELVVTSI